MSAVPPEEHFSKPFSSPCLIQMPLLWSDRLITFTVALTYH